MRVWLVTIGEPLPTDAGNERLHRTGTFAEILAAQGHEVDWWTSTFNHFSKELRETRTAEVPIAPGYKIRMLHGGGYSRNISLSRLRDHRKIASEFTRLASTLPAPDVIVTALPDLTLTAAAVEYGKAHGVPVIIDVRDLWPDIFRDVFPRQLQPLASIALSPLERMAKRAAKGAFAIWGHAPAFVDWGLAHAGRGAGEFDRAFPFGYKTDGPAPAEIEAATEAWRQLGITKDFDGFTACFVGTVGHQTELAGVVDAARLIASRGNIRFVICGAGDRLKDTRASASDLHNIVFAGWRRRAEVWTILRLSQIGIAPYKDRADFRATIPNKVPEYLSAGLPIALNLSTGLVCQLLADNQCGFSYHHNPRELAERLVSLSADRDRLRAMSARAGALFEERFRAERVYGEMVRALDGVVREYAAARHPAAL